MSLRPRSAMVVTAALLLASAAAWGGPVASASPDSERPAAAADVVAGRYIVVLRPTADAARVAGAHGRSMGFTPEHVYSHALKGYAGVLPAAAVAKLRQDPQVAYVTEDRVVRASATAPVVAGDSVPRGVRRIGAATKTAVHTASTVNVAIIDTGVHLTHPDLNARSGKNCIKSGASANDDNGHGSHVAGTIAARNNGSGVIGVAPGTKLYAVKVLNWQGSGSTSSVICGIDWVTANASALNIRVANVSLGGGGSNDNNCGNTNHDPQHQAICRSTAAGVTYVVAAGNDGGDQAAHVPASYP